MGMRMRTRMCESGVPGVPGCEGKSREETMCDAGQGEMSQWSEFSRCSATCNGGIMTR